MGEQFDIYFSASGTYKQVIEIVDTNYTPQMVVDGLNKNTLFTTMWHGVTAPLEVCDYAGRTVAKVLRQEATDDNEYSDFELYQLDKG